MNNSGFEEERDNSNETGRIDDAIRGRGVVRRSTRTRATVRDTDTAENPLRTGTRFIIERPFKTDSFWNNQTTIRFFSYSVGGMATVYSAIRRTTNNQRMDLVGGGRDEIVYERVFFFRKAAKELFNTISGQTSVFFSSLLTLLNAFH